MISRADLLYGVDGDTRCTGDYEMTILNVWSNFIQNKGDNVWFYSQKENITLVDGLLVASCQVHSHFL